MDGIIALLSTICICAVLPITIVWLGTRSSVKKNEQKMNVLMKAIENGVDIDPALLVNETKSSVSTKIQLIKKLTAGVICSIIGIAVIVCTQLEAFDGVAGLEMLYIIGGVLIAVGVANIVAFFVGRRYLAPEIEAEEKNLEK